MSASPTMVNTTLPWRSDQIDFFSSGKPDGICGPSISERRVPAASFWLADDEGGPGCGLSLTGPFAIAGFARCFFLSEFLRFVIAIQFYGSRCKGRFQLQASTQA